MNLEKNINNIINYLCEKYNIIQKEISDFQYGGANIVKKVTINSKPVVLKIYRKEYDFELIQYFLKYGDLKILDNEKLGNCYVYFYNYINGIHKINYKKSDIIKILNIIENNSKINIEKYKNFECHYLWYKLQKYFNYFINKKDNYKVKEKIIKKLIALYNQNVLILKNNCVLIHGDLSLTNILWNNNVPILIDYDECSFAPKEYEIASFLIKTCFSNGIFNTNLGSLIIIEAKKRINNLNINILKKCYYLFIVKVLIEKFYYCDKYGLDIESSSQKKDYWVWWYDLLNNNAIYGELFNEKT